MAACVELLRCTRRTPTRRAGRPIPQPGSTLPGLWAPGGSTEAAQARSRAACVPVDELGVVAGWLSYRRPEVEASEQRSWTPPSRPRGTAAHPVLEVVDSGTAARTRCGRRGWTHVDTRQQRWGTTDVTVHCMCTRRTAEAYRRTCRSRRHAEPADGGRGFGRSAGTAAVHSAASESGPAAERLIAEEAGAASRRAPEPRQCRAALARQLLPAQVEAERVPRRIEEHADIVLGLASGERCAHLDCMGDCGVKVADLEVEVQHHLLAPFSGRPDRWHVLRGRLEAQVRHTVRRRNRCPVGLVLGDLPNRAGASRTARAPARRARRARRPTIETATVRA